MVTSLFGAGRDYRKLGPARLTWLGSVRLWEGEDHFLQSELIFAYEYYRRFYYKDIKAFTLSPSRRGAYWHFALLTLTAIFVGLALLSAWETGSFSALEWTLVVFASLVLIAWLVHFLLGPTCVCHVVTPVQRERLASLSRTPSARKALDRLASRATAAQSHLPPLAEGEQGASPAVVVPFPKETITPPEAQPEPPKTLSVILAMLSFAVAGGLFSMLVWQTPILRATTVIGVLAVMTLAISCLATRRVRGIAVPANWILVIFSFALFLGWYFWAVVDVMESRRSAPAVEVEYFRMFLNASTHDSAFLRWSSVAAGALNMLCGALDLVMAFPWHRAASAPGATGPPEGK